MHFRSFAPAFAVLTLGLTLAPLSALAHQHDQTAEHKTHTDGEAQAYTAGDVVVETPWSRATPPGANVAAGYMTVRNDGAQSLRFRGGSTPAAEHVEIHAMEVVDDVMQMRELAEGLEIAPGETLALEPGGYHLMLFGLLEPLQAGARIPLTLTFEDGTDIDVELEVHALGAGAHQGGHSAH